MLLFVIIGVIQTPINPTNHINVQHEVTTQTPRPGEPITVTVTITNTSDNRFTDLRIIDNVPEELEVTNTSARTATTLNADESTTFSYTVTAKRGEFTFDSCFIRTRSSLGTTRRDVKISTSNPVTVTCSVSIEDIPVEDTAANFIGQLLGQDSGEGLEFDKTREYHHGDSPRRINWRALAKRNELSTVMYREQQAATITIILDARTRSYISENTGEQSIPIISGYAAYKLTTALGENNHAVNLIAPGLDSSGEVLNKYGYYQFEHSTHRENKYNAFKLLDEIEKKESRVSKQNVLEELRGNSNPETIQSGADRDTVFDVNDGTTIRVDEMCSEVQKWNTNTTQYIVISPLLDDAMHRLCREISKTNDLLIIAPNATNNTKHTAEDKPKITALSERLLAVQQKTRIQSLKNTGVRVIDWDINTPLSIACQQQTLIQRNK
jgi:uncharacterized repeat protein (TIGR01451 family)